MGDENSSQSVFLHFQGVESSSEGASIVLRDQVLAMFIVHLACKALVLLASSVHMSSPGFPGRRPEIRTCVQVVYLGVDPRELVRWGRIITCCVTELVTL